MMQKTIQLWLIILIVGISVTLTETAYADGPPEDYACRGCHGDNQRELILPSEEVLPLLVPLEALKQSPHHYSGEAPVYCTSCHDRATYQYPHQSKPVQTLAEYRANATQVCQDCHTTHNPFHKIEPAPDNLPNCVDCHGSHTIDRTADILNSMPANCLACHEDETLMWVEEYITPRMGWGRGAEGYVGSDTCRGCHEENYFSWEETRHAQMVQGTSAIMGDFSQTDLDENVISYTLGSRWKQNYLTYTDEGAFKLLPAEWHVESGEWATYTPPDGDWRQTCGSCHVTGLDTETWQVTEFGIGCESCHGPGAEHVAYPERTQPYKEVDDQVCGACHSRGQSPDGLPFPASYHPGDVLTDHFTFTTDSKALWPNGAAKQNNQQYTDWQQGNLMAASGQVQCATCHDMHGSGTGHSQLVEPAETLCLSCHGDKQAIINHVPYHNKAITKHSFTCVDCHMPQMAISAEPYDIRSHTFHQPDPETSVEHGGREQMLNACNSCHTKPAETAEWAVSTINHAKNWQQPNTGASFGVGATPNSPPPPTPLPSVGEPAEIFYVEFGYPLRVMMMGIVVLVVIASLYLGAVIWFEPPPQGGN